MYCRAATMETALPRVDPMASGLSLRLVSSSDGSSPSFERAIRRPPRNQGRTDAGICPSKMVEARLKRARELTRGAEFKEASFEGNHIRVIKAQGGPGGIGDGIKGSRK